MRDLTVPLMLLGIGLFAFGCSSSTASPDDAGVDAGVDGGVDGGDEGGDQAQVSGKTRVNVTSGGGAAQSASHKVRLHVGAPQPYGEAASDGHQVQSGPKPNP